MREPNIPYSIIGVSFDNRELASLKRECERSDKERSVVIKQALKYWLSLDPDQRDQVIM
jgi:hypothetical protein